MSDGALEPVSAATEPDSPPWRGRPAWIEIDLDAVAENVRRVAAWVGPTTQVLAVVKADGYGLGAAQIGAAALAGGATWLGVAAVDEGMALRAAGLDAPILVMGPATLWETDRAVAAELTLTVNSLEVAQALAAAATRYGRRVPLHLKLDSGLHRFGRAPDDLAALAEAVAALPDLQIAGLYSHFANADDPHDHYALDQLNCLLAMQHRLAALGIHPALLHAASSAAMLELPESHLDLVRVGIVLSGHLPAPDIHRPFDLLPAVTIRARLARVFPAAAGATVGYGRTYTAPAPRTLALVTLGYADGYHRALSNCGWMLVGGQRVPVVGRISMDQCTLDVTAVPGVAEGDPVVVAGTQGTATLTLWDLAEAAGTIPYELLTHLSKRLPRLYRRGGTVVEMTTLLGHDLPI
ncbi:MAG: alanine racemase [Chloroflexota bacterium]|nr:alanine racemase [Chloroflexota bacterium]